MARASTSQADGELIPRSTCEIRLAEQPVPRASSRTARPRSSRTSRSRGPRAEAGSNGRMHHLCWAVGLCPAAGVSPRTCQFRVNDTELSRVLCLDVDNPSLHAFYVDLHRAHLGSGATDPQSEGEPGMSYLIRKAVDRQWADSATTPGLRETVLVGGADGTSHLEIRLCELRAGAAMPAHRHPFEESWYIFSGQGRRSVAGLRYDVAVGDCGSAR